MPKVGFRQQFNAIDRLLYGERILIRDSCGSKVEDSANAAQGSWELADYGVIFTQEEGK